MLTAQCQRISYALALILFFLFIYIQRLPPATAFKLSKPPSPTVSTVSTALLLVMHSRFHNTLIKISILTSTICSYTDEYDVVVIGGGPGGYPAAIKAAQSGLKVKICNYYFFEWRASLTDYSVWFRLLVLKSVVLLVVPAWTSVVSPPRLCWTTPTSTTKLLMSSSLVVLMVSSEPASFLTLRHWSSSAILRRWIIINLRLLTRIILLHSWWCQAQPRQHA